MGTGNLPETKNLSLSVEEGEALSPELLSSAQIAGLKNKKVLIIGAGLAGTEAAWFLARHGVTVILMECKRFAPNPAQKMKTAAELVCTNSLKSMDPHTGHGLLKREMQKLGSLILDMAYQHKVPAGEALTVDRLEFSQAIEAKLLSHPLITYWEKEATDPLAHQLEIGADAVIIATGPLTSEKLEQWIMATVASDDFYFYDAIAPVVDADSLNYDKLYFKDRHGLAGSGDYLNAPMDKAQYENFISELVKAEKVPPKDFEELRYFEACLPIDTMATRGPDTARFSCMKPIGLEMPDGTLPYAVVQMRKENLLGSAYNLVGFQTRLTYKEQVRVFRLIPGLEEAEFIHLGSCHRNSFLHAKKLLNPELNLKQSPSIYFAGQMTGVEGYTESASSGLYVALNILQRLLGKTPVTWPANTAIGALVHYLMTADRPCPSNINMGLFPTPEAMDQQWRQLKKSLRQEKRGARRGDKKGLKKEMVALAEAQALHQTVELIRSNYQANCQL